METIKEKVKARFRLPYDTERERVSDNGTNFLVSQSRRVFFTWSLLAIAITFTFLISTF